MVLQNYQNFIEMTSNMIYIVALGNGFKCPRKIYLNTQWGGGGGGGKVAWGKSFVTVERFCLFFATVDKTNPFPIDFRVDVV
jgi:hypothetical protein